MAGSSEDKKDQTVGENSADNLPRLPDGNVDVDQLKIKILILGKSIKGCESIANYLVRRGWQTTVNTNIKDAFQTVATFKPDFVVISVNLPTPKIHQLPTVMSQTFKIPSIIFGEGTDTKTIALLQNIQSTYKMTGAVSGPSAHRRIKQILQEIYLPQDATDKKDEASGEEDGSITIKGSQAQADKERTTTVKSKNLAYVPTSQASVKAKGPAVFIAKGGAGLGDKAEQEGATTNQLEDNNSVANLDELAAMFQTPDDSKGMQVNDDDGVEPSDVGMTLEDILDHVTESIADESNEALDGQSKTRSNLAGNNKLAERTHPQNSEGASVGDRQQPDGYTGGPGTTHSAPTTTKALEGEADGKSAGANNANSEATKASPAPTRGSDSPNANDFSSESTNNDRPKKEKKQYAIVEMFDVVTAIAEECVLMSVESQARTALVEESTIIPIDSTNQRGYLFVAAIGVIAEEVEFINKFVKKLKTVLPKEFTNINIGTEQRIHFVALEVTDKIEGETKHLHLRNGSSDIYIKYIKESRYEAKVIDSAPVGSNKAEIDPKELVPNTAVGVEVFMHLPKNEKFYQYLKPRSSISDKQKEKLVSSSVKLYINKPATGAYRDSLRKNKTLETIFDTSKRNKKAS